MKESIPVRPSNGVTGHHFCLVYLSGTIWLIYIQACLDSHKPLKGNLCIHSRPQCRILVFSDVTSYSFLLYFSEYI